MKKLTTIVASTAIAASFVAGNVAASENPFAMQPVTGDLNVATKGDACIEGKCGGEKGKEAKCGSEKT